jgi:serine/threonine-protein kinase
MELRRVEAALPARDLAAPMPSPSAISSHDAQAVWLRAAELQDHTGSVPARALQPRAPLVPQDPGTSAYQLDQVRNAAREAGIGTQFVDRALVERGLVPAPDAPSAEAPIAVRDGIVPPYNWWLGGHSSIAFEATVQGEMPERDFDLMVDIIGRAMNDAGTATTVGRSLKWASTDRQRKVQVSVLVRDGRTTIYVGERLKDLIGALYGGIIGGGGGATTGPAIGITAGALGIPLLVAPVLVTTIGSAFAIARYALRRVTRSRSQVLKALTERLAEQARDSIARRAVGPGFRQDMRLLR